MGVLFFRKSFNCVTSTQKVLVRLVKKSWVFRFMLLSVNSSRSQGPPLSFFSCLYGLWMVHYFRKAFSYIFIIKPMSTSRYVCLPLYLHQYGTLSDRLFSLLVTILLLPLFRSLGRLVSLRFRCVLQEEHQWSITSLLFFNFSGRSSLVNILVSHLDLPVCNFVFWGVTWTFHTFTGSQL